MVMAGPVPAIHVLFTVNFKESVDARDIWREDALSRFSAGMTRKGQPPGITRKPSIRSCPALHLCL
jgi:hypothetical protein